MRSRLATVVVAIAALGLLVAAPVALAKPSKTDKSQNKALKTQGKSIKSLGKSTKALGKSTKSAASAIAALKVIANRGDKNASTVLAAAPAIIQGLTDLKNGLTQAAAGLTSLQTLATSQEYGIGQVFIAGTAAPGSFIETPDIPDSAQQAQVTQTFVAGTAGAITLQVGVRGNESDGTGATNPAAFCRVTEVSGANSTTSSATAGPNPVAPAPYYPINLKSPLTSTTETGFPFGPISTDNLTDLTVNGTNSANPTGTAATAVIGAPYTISLSCIDPSASATDPSA
jgi:hypothetical protein